VAEAQVIPAGFCGSSKPDSYDGEISDEDFRYTWTWFENVRDLYRKVAASGRAVIFTVDQ
jgi:Domain of unknown function (DUF1877)